MEHFVRNLAIEQGVPRCLVHVNRADDPQSGAFHLTVTRTSVEAGDDGQVGRGNRANGLITPYRPMMLDAVAGKNSAAQVGKICYVVTRKIAATLVSEEPDITAAQSLLLGQIGAPVTEPALLHFKIATRNNIPVAKQNAQKR